MDKRLLRALPLALTLALAGCMGEKSAPEHVESAQKFLATNDLPSAVIELKSAVQLAPKDDSYRQMLADVYLRQGNLPSAEKEVLKAIELTGATDERVSLLGAMAFEQYRYRDIVELEDAYPDVAVQPQSQALILAAKLILERNDELAAKIDGLTGDTAEVLVAKIYQALYRSEQERAQELAERMVSQHSQYALGQFVGALVAQATQQQEQPIARFQAYFQLRPQASLGRIFLAQALVRAQQVDEASKHLTPLSKALPKHPLVNDMLGQVALHKKDYESALNHAEKVLQVVPNKQSAQLVAGVSAFYMKRFESAYQYLSLAVPSLPKAHPTHRLLAVTQLKLGYTDEATDTLASLEVAEGTDTALFAVASYDLLRKGETAQAQRLLQQSEAMLGEDAKDYIRYGILQLKLDEASGLASLEKAVELDPNAEEGTLALAIGYLETGHFDKALEIADKWQNEKPDEAIGFNLAASAYHKLGDEAAMERQLTLAMEKADANPTSRLYFAQKSLQSKEYKDAEKHVNVLLETYPKHIKGLMLYFDIQRALGSADKGRDKLKSAFDANNDSLDLRLVYAKSLVFTGDADKALDVLESVPSSIEKSQDYWSTLVDIYYGSEQFNKALGVVNQWQEGYPRNKLTWIKELTILERQRKPAEALIEMERARKYFPDDPQLNLLKSHFLLATGKAELALEAWQELPEDWRNSAGGKEIRARIYVGQNKFAPAIRLFNEVYEQKPDQRITKMLFDAYRLSGQQDKAYAFAEKHIESYPKANKIRNALAEAYIKDNGKAAIQHYQWMVDNSAASPVIFNNLAWLYYTEKSYSKAEALAKKAMDAMPSNPQVMDTAAVIYLAQDKVKEALKLLELAQVKMPSSVDIKLHYAEALIKSGRQQDAKHVLDDLKVEEPQHQSEVKKLRRLL
ncbi:MAG: PEP-CTERM system TPR-repeat protein PrsT [Kangiellaceae bacterium]|nr:PEP-CTERM system TPR-repeat protein PrsT [Kangiellaceae bacterium]